MEQASMSKGVERFSDVDFNDVFGGPPRRLSMQDMHANYNYDETNKWRYSWSCSGKNEMPVFGEVHSTRKRYTNDSFFDDVFQGDKKHLDSPGSRVLSLARPLPPNAELFAPSSLPADFSLPANLSKEVDLQASRTYKTTNSTSNGTQHLSTLNISPRSFSSEAIDEREELIHDVRSYCQSSLSRENFLNSKASSNSTTSDISNKLDKSGKGSDLENTKKSSQLHTGKGVLSLNSIRTGRKSKLKEKTKFEKSSTFRSWFASKSLTENLHNAKASADSQEADKDSSREDYKDKEHKLLPDGSSEHILEIQYTIQEPDPLLFKTETMNSIQESGNDIPENHRPPNAKPRDASQILFEELGAKKSDDEIFVEAQESAARSLPVLFYNEECNIGNTIFNKVEAKEDKGKPTKQSSVFNPEQKKQDEEGSTQNNERVNKCGLQSSYTKKGDNEGQRNFKGKVKEFVKIFNQEVSWSSKIDIDTMSQSDRWTSSTWKMEKEETIETTKTNDEKKIPNVNAERMSTNASIKADVYHKERRNQHPARKSSDYVPNDTSAGEKDSSASNTETSDGDKATAGVSEDYVSGNLQVNDALQAKDDTIIKENNHEDARVVVVDTQIHKWSNGKEGNIRSLLSTLQYASI